MSNPALHVSPSREQVTRRLEQEVGVLVRRVRRTVVQRARMVHPDLAAASYSILLALRGSAPMRSSELAELFALDKGAVSRRVKQLVELGFVVRTPDPDDGRAHLLAPTETALQRLAEVDRLRREWYADALAGWPEEDIAGLAEVMARYNATLG